MDATRALPASAAPHAAERPAPEGASRGAVGGMTTLIAWRNLVHDRVRFVVTLVGIVFSVVLMGMQTGLLVGFVQTTSGLVTHSGADLWIAPRGTKNVDLSNLMSDRTKYLARTVPGVASAESYFVTFARWKRPDGGRETVLLVGSEPNASMGGPWNLAQGTRADLALPDGVIIDRLYAEKLGVTRVGETVEINDERARVVGFTHHVRTFTQSPYVFTTLSKAQTLAGFGQGLTTYVLVRLAPGADRAAVERGLAERLPDADVVSTAAFASKSESYWLFTTGAGMSLILSALLGLVVGIVIVAQTLYASTVDRLPEYATLRAMGAPRGYLYRIIVTQAVLGGVFGYAIGIALVALLVRLSVDSSAAPRLPLWLAGSLGVVTLAMCVSAALISIRKVTKLDPVAVFR
jgi:putative ABC transport system permease protein